MKLNFVELTYSMSNALDAVEKEMTGAMPGHGNRVGYYSALIAKSLNLPKADYEEFVSCAVLHDNGIAEFHRNDTDVKKEVRLTRYFFPVEWLLKGWIHM